MLDEHLVKDSKLWYFSTPVPHELRKKMRKHKVVLAIGKLSSMTYEQAITKADDLYVKTQSKFEYIGGHRKCRVVAEKVMQSPVEIAAKKVLSKNSKPFRTAYSHKKSRAKRDGVVFTIPFESITFPTHCPVLNVKLDYQCGGKGGKALQESPSFDRIDPAQGYVEGNVQIISFLANSMKNNASPEQLLMFAAWINKTYA